MVQILTIVALGVITVIMMVLMTRAYDRIAMLECDMTSVKRLRERLDILQEIVNNNTKSIRLITQLNEIDISKTTDTVPEGHKLCLYRVAVNYSRVYFLNEVETTESGLKYVQHFDDPPTAGDIIAILRNHIGDSNHVNSIDVDMVNLTEF